MIAKAITIMIYDWNGVCLAMSISEQMAGLSATNEILLRTKSGPEAGILGKWSSRSIQWFSTLSKRR
jgi:hypothetical protein